MTVLLRGALLEGLAVVAAVPIFAQSVVPNGHQIAGYFLVACFALLAAGLVVTLAGYRKASLERAGGYTTVLGHARSEPALSLVSPRTFRVLSPPHTPRPSRMPRD